MRGRVGWPASWWCGIVHAVMASGLLAACSSNDNGAATATATRPPVVAPPVQLDVQRGLAACFIRQEQASTIPGVKGYRLVATQPLPEGLTPTVKNVRFLGAGDTRVLESEICFNADQNTAPARVDAQLELRLFTADAEKLGANDKLQPVRTLPFSQVVVVK